MECGKHPRPRNILEKPRTKSDYDPKPSQRYHRCLRGDRAGSCICDYYDFPQLRQDRENLDPKYKASKF